MKSKKSSTKSKLETLLAEQIENAGLPTPVQQYRFMPPRRYMFDFAYPEQMIAIEVEGGTWGKPVVCHACGVVVKVRRKDGKLVPVFSGGRHNRPGGYASDAEKYNLASLRGWMLLRFTGATIKDGSAIECIRKALEVYAARLLCETSPVFYSCGDTSVLPDQSIDGTEREE